MISLLWHDDSCLLRMTKIFTSLIRSEKYTNAHRISRNVNTQTPKSYFSYSKDLQHVVKQNPIRVFRDDIQETLMCFSAQFDNPSVSKLPGWLFMMDKMHVYLHFLSKQEGALTLTVSVGLLQWDRMNTAVGSVPILWTSRCRSTSLKVGLVPKDRITMIRSLASIFPFRFLS